MDKKNYIGSVTSTKVVDTAIREFESISIEQKTKAKVKRSDLILLTTQLSIMLESGVILSDALDAITLQTDNPVFKNVLNDICLAVKNGERFSKALTYYPRIFDSMFISMVKASEASGKMSEMLSIISGYIEFEYQTRKKVKGALTYPFIMALVAMTATGSLMFFVLPRFTKIYESRSASLPKLTQVLLGISDALRNVEIMTIVLTSLIFVGAGIHYWAKTVAGRKIIDYSKIKMPIFGPMFVDMIVARSMRIMSTMLKTGVTLLEAIEVIKGSCNNYYFSNLWGWIDEKVRNGYQLSEAIQICPDKNVLAPAVVQMLKAGEKSGYLSRVSDKISIFYEKQLENSIDTATRLIEPIMILIIGSIVGTIAIALLLPVFKISTVISQ